MVSTRARSRPSSPANPRGVGLLRGDSRPSALSIEVAGGSLVGEAPGPLAPCLGPTDDPAVAARIELDAHHTTLAGQPLAAPLPLASCHENLPQPQAANALRREKAPQMRGFRRCAEEDSNLHPVIPDQALNLVTRVSYLSCASIPSRTSGNLDISDAMDDLDVATDVATGQVLRARPMEPASPPSPSPIAAPSSAPGTSPSAAPSPKESCTDRRRRVWCGRTPGSAGPMSQTVGAHILERLHAHGISRVYGYPGDGINGILGGFHEHGDEIEFVQAAHEELAALMACAHAKFSGDVGVCLATSGPGAIHLLNGALRRQARPSAGRRNRRPAAAPVARRQIPAGGRPRLALQGRRERVRPGRDGASAGHAPDRPRRPDRARNPLGHLRDRLCRPPGSGGRDAAARSRLGLLGWAHAEASGAPARSRPRVRRRGAQRRRARRDPDRPGPARPPPRSRRSLCGSVPASPRHSTAATSCPTTCPSSPARSACSGRRRATR
jgi:hypothetical protein